MQKDTSEIVKQLQLSPDFQTFYRENREYMVDKSLAQLLEQLLQEQGISNAKAIHVDPAVMASPFITTIVDALSLLVYFLFASMLL